MLRVAGSRRNNDIRNARHPARSLYWSSSEITISLFASPIDNLYTIFTQRSTSILWLSYCTPSYQILNYILLSDAVNSFNSCMIYIDRDDIYFYIWNCDESNTHGCVNFFGIIYPYNGDNLSARFPYCVSRSEGSLER